MHYDDFGNLLTNPKDMITFSGVGATTGFAIGLFLEKHFINFSTDISVKHKLFRLLIGVILYLPFYYIGNNLMVKIIGGIWNGFFFNIILWIFTLAGRTLETKIYRCFFKILINACWICAAYINSRGCHGQLKKHILISLIFYSIGDILAPANYLIGGISYFIGHIFITFGYIKQYGMSKKQILFLRNCRYHTDHHTYFNVRF